jgi:hypothetical protein
MYKAMGGFLPQTTMKDLFEKLTVFPSIDLRYNDCNFTMCNSLSYTSGASKKFIHFYVMNA